MTAPFSTFYRRPPEADIFGGQVGGLPARLIGGQISGSAEEA